MEKLKIGQIKATPLIERNYIALAFYAMKTTLNRENNLTKKIYLRHNQNKKTIKKQYKD